MAARTHCIPQPISPLTELRAASPVRPQVAAEGHYGPRLPASATAATSDAAQMARADGQRGPTAHVAVFNGCWVCRWGRRGLGG